MRGKIWNYIKIFFGGFFWLGILGVFAMYLLDANLPIFFDKYKWSVLQENSDVIMTVADIICFGVYFSMVFVFAGLAFGTQFYREWNSGIVPQMICKWGMKKYTFTYSCLAAISGGIISSGGFLLYIIYMAYHMPILNPVLVEQHKDLDMYIYAMDGNGIKYIFIMAFLLFVLGAFIGIMFLCLSTVLDDRYILMLIPYIVYRAYVEIVKLLDVPSKYRIDYYLFGRIDIGDSYRDTVIILTGILLILIFAGQFFFRKGVKRRLHYGKY